MDRRALSLCLLISAGAAAAPRAAKALENVAPAAARSAPADLDADLATVRDTTQWFFRETLLGWTADHRLVFRSAVCDPDDGGGRGAYCDILLCTSRTDDAEALHADCAPLATLDLDEGDVRTKLDAAAARKAEADALGSLGPLSPGTAIPTRSFRPSTVRKRLALTRSGRAGKGTIPLFSFDDPSMSERAQLIDSAKVTAASTDGTCAGAIGHFRFRSDYEGVPTRTPMFFGAVRCR